MSADFSQAAAALATGLRAHADRDGLTGVLLAVFIDRGGHAVGEACPSAPEPDLHLYWCEWPERECMCPPLGLGGRGGDWTSGLSMCTVTVMSRRAPAPNQEDTMTDTTTRDAETEATAFRFAHPHLSSVNDVDALAEKMIERQIPLCGVCKSWHFAEDRHENDPTRLEDKLAWQAQFSERI